MTATLLLQGFHIEAAREAIVGTTVDVVVSAVFAVVLAWLGHHHLVLPARRRHAELRAHAIHQTQLVEETHYLAHRGEPHPRVQERLDRGEDHTPALEHEGAPP